jgi:hypothetical protein
VNGPSKQGLLFFHLQDKRGTTLMYCTGFFRSFPSSHYAHKNAAKWVIFCSGISRKEEKGLGKCHGFSDSRISSCQNQLSVLAIDSI